jgi:hypothetical protein
MSNNNVYYINIKPYIYDLSFDLMLHRFFNSSIFNKYNIGNKNEFKEYMITFMNNYQYLFRKKTVEEQNIDKQLSIKILNHLHIFFDKPFNMNTRKNLYKKGKNKTRKQNK